MTRTRIIDIAIIGTATLAALAGAGTVLADGNHPYPTYPTTSTAPPTTSTPTTSTAPPTTSTPTTSTTPPTEPPTTTTQPPATTTTPPTTTEPTPETTTPTTAPPADVSDQDLTGTATCGAFRGEATNTGTAGRAAFTIYVDGAKVDAFILNPGEDHDLLYRFPEDTGVHTVQVDWAEGPSGWTVASDCQVDTDIGTPAVPSEPPVRMPIVAPGPDPATIELPETK